MKQHITKKQWDELSGLQRNKLRETQKDYDAVTSIGQMIEYLGDDLDDISNNKDNDWTVYIDDNEPLDPNPFYSKELCDALWEAVKYKLKQ